MRVAAFVKQVPDLRVGSVGTRPDGTIDRGAAPAITNPADLHALEAALQIADEVVVFSMGPPAAEAALRDALAHGANEAVLVTDRAFAGSDTWATANVLASAVRRWGDFDLFLCGISALDGETGNVGPQLAERLGVPHATGCEALTIAEGRLLVRRVVEGGYESLAMSLPALLTVAETGFTPRYPTLPHRRSAATAEIPRLTADHLALPPDQAGLAASPTKVAHMEFVPLPEVETQYVGTDLTYEQLATMLRSRAAPPAAVATAAESDGDPPPAQVEADESDPSVWVVCELHDGALTAAAAQLLTKANHLSASLAGGVAAFVAGSSVEEAVEEAAAFGADLVLVASDPRLSPYRSLPYARVLGDALAARRPPIVLFAATSIGRDLAPRVAARLDTGLAADCTELRIADWRRGSQTYERLLHQVRPAMAGSVLATCICPEKRPQMATIRPGVFDARLAPKHSRVETLEVDLTSEDQAVQVVERNIKTSATGLAEASVVVAGGAGCSAENWYLIEDLASVLGGSVAASRAAVEAGLAPRKLQVGQTGTSVKPDLYIACGISGAFQHVVGMQAAELVVAVNRDPEAAIFRFAHYGIVADVAEALPFLTKALGSGG